jgi:hypothetical protein
VTSVGHVNSSSRESLFTMAIGNIFFGSRIVNRFILVFAWGGM